MDTFVVDFEFRPLPGRNPRPWCVAWHCLETGGEGSLWLDGHKVASPLPEQFRMVAHYALAELACFLELGWQVPDEVIDTIPEMRVVRGQVPTFENSWSLLAVACQLGVPTCGNEHKEVMRALAMESEIPSDRKAELLAYCLDDVRTETAIWKRISPLVNIPEAVLRGRYLKALSRVERRGIPADVELIENLRKFMPEIREAGWAEARQAYPGSIGPNGNFSSLGWLDWCEQEGIPWPKHGTGAPDLDIDIFKEMANRFPSVRVMTDARKLRSQGRKFEFPLGQDGRLRSMLSPFSSETGRNQPSNSRFVFGASAWMRSVIAAPPGKVLAYVDYAAQEVGLAAALSCDDTLGKDYLTGDPYIAFAIRARSAPPGATKATHPNERATYKVAALALQYGIGDETLGQKLGISTPAARRIISAHKAVYPAFWRWRQAVIDEVTGGGIIATSYGWTRRAKEEDSSNSISNFLVQATGAEILRVAVIALEEAGHHVVAPVHDALLVEMDESTWRQELREVRGLMERATEVVTRGLRIRTDFEIVFPGENFLDKRGTGFWQIVQRVIGRGPIRLPDEVRQRLLESHI